MRPVNLPPLCTLGSAAPLPDVPGFPWLHGAELPGPRIPWLSGEATAGGGSVVVGWRAALDPTTQRARYLVVQVPSWIWAQYREYRFDLRSLVTLYARNVWLADASVEEVEGSVGAVLAVTVPDILRLAAIGYLPPLHLYCDQQVRGRLPRDRVEHLACLFDAARDRALAELTTLERAAEPDWQALLKQGELQGRIEALRWAQHLLDREVLPYLHAPSSITPIEDALARAEDMRRATEVTAEGLRAQVLALQAAVKLPELPPRYTVDEAEGEWLVTVRGEWDDREDAGNPTREDAVDATWDEFMTYDCDAAWRAFLHALRGAR